MVKRTHKRDELISAGRALIVRRGFNATGLSDILAAADVPKGSFYYYFESKEDFGLALIEDEAKDYQKKLKATLDNQQLSPLDRLRQYFLQGIGEMEASQCEAGCLFGNLSQEMAACNPVFRDRIDDIFIEWENSLAICLEAAYEEGDIAQRPDPELAQFVLSGWQGALMRSKTAKSTAPLHGFINTLFKRILNL